MSANRTAPAYQEYAANLIARFEYRVLTLPQRGLLYTLKLECWVNQYLPESPAVLARVLGLDVAEVTAELPAVMPFFACENGRIISPELEAYRQRVETIRARQAQGGKVGAAKTNARKTRAGAGGSGKATGNPTSKTTGKARVSRRVSDESFNPSPSQQRDGLPTTYRGDTEEWGGWADFTADPEQGGGV